MKVFVTGGTGVIGRPAIRKLLAEGHEVTALAHSESAQERLSRLGARPVRADLFDPESLRQVLAGADAVLHLATRIPASSQMRKASAWAENNRIRIEGTSNLVDAALANDVGVFVYPSVVFMYRDSADKWVDATRATVKSTPVVKSTLEAESQVQRFSESGGRGVVLRLGWIYGPESMHTREAAEYARKGMAAIFGKSDSYQSWIWEEDAAEAVVLAMEHAPAGTYDVVDDQPVQRAELVGAMAAGLQRKRVRRLPGIMLKLVAGAELAEMSSRSQRVSNQRFKEVTGWSPSVRSVHDGWRRLGQ